MTWIRKTGLCMWRDKRCQMQSGHFGAENLQRGRAYDQQRITDHERYSRRWNLRLFGVKEEQQDDTWRVAVEICQACCLNVKINFLTLYIGSAPNAQTTSVPDLLSSSSSLADPESLWKAAKTSPFLKENRDLKFAEDLSWEERERCSKMWPIIEKARRENKKAYYVGCRGFVNGTEVFPSSEWEVNTGELRNRKVPTMLHSCLDLVECFSLILLMFWIIKSMLHLYFEDTLSFSTWVVP